MQKIFYQEMFFDNQHRYTGQYLVSNVLLQQHKTLFIRNAYY
jgi:hypothetical protein